LYDRQKGHPQQTPKQSKPSETQQSHSPSAL
jgi:hypothetical protein